MGISVAHQIKEGIIKDFNKVLASPEMIAFKKNLSFKSERTRKVDENVVNLLLNRLEMYKNGWIQANAMQTVALTEKQNLVEPLSQKLENEYREFNDLINAMIIKFKGDLTPEMLESLRSIERQIQKIQKK